MVVHHPLVVIPPAPERVLDRTLGRALAQPGRQATDARGSQSRSQALVVRGVEGGEAVPRGGWQHLGGGVPVHDVVGTPENSLPPPGPPEEALATAVEEQGGREHGAAPVLDRSVLDRVPEVRGG